MFAIIRSYESVDRSRTAELVKKVDETLLPRLSEMPGFGGYHLIKSDDGTMSSVGFFDTAAQADESTKIVSGWVRDEKFEKVLPSPPRITTGEIVAHKTRELVTA